jgi:hypothetical protein
MSYKRANYRDKWRVERHAARIRADLGLDQHTPLDPHRLADTVPAHVFYPEDLGDGDLISRVRALPWDGFGFSFPGEETLMVVLNSGRAQTRQTATLMEELAHHLLGHTPSRIAADPATGLLRRAYDREQEQEAYDLGAAILLPKEMIGQAVKADQRHAGAVAEEHRCSSDLVGYRIRRLRLWKRYCAYAKG